MNFSEKAVYKFNATSGVPFSDLFTRPGKDTPLNGVVIGFFSGVFLGSLVSFLTKGNIAKDIETKSLSEHSTQSNMQAGRWQLGLGAIGAAIGGIADYLR